LRKGSYLNNNAFGRHIFYENNLINCHRFYIIPAPYFIDLDSKSEYIKLQTYFPVSDTTFLNSVIYFKTNGDTIFEKSLFYKNLGFVEKSDTTKMNLKFYFQNFTIEGIEFYTMPKDTSMVTLSGSSGNNHFLNVDPVENLDLFKSMAIIYGYDGKSELDSNKFTTRAIFINEKTKTSYNKK